MSFWLSFSFESSAVEPYTNVSALTYFFLIIRGSSSLRTKSKHSANRYLKQTRLCRPHRNLMGISLMSSSRLVYSCLEHTLWFGWIQFSSILSILAARCLIEKCSIIAFSIHLLHCQLRRCLIIYWLKRIDLNPIFYSSRRIQSYFRKVSIVRMGVDYLFLFSWMSSLIELSF